MTGLVLLLAFPAQWAHASACPARLEDRTSLCTPAPEEEKQLVEDIRGAVEAAVKYQEANGLEQRARTALKRIADPVERDFALDQWDKAFSDASRLRASALTKMAEVAARVQASYGIRSPAGERGIVNGPFAGKTVSWSLGVQLDRDDVRQEFTPDGRSRYLGFPKKDQSSEDRVAGLTADDGKVLLGVGAFEIARDVDPAVLALAIYHESVHFEQLTTAGWGTRAKVESEAYAAELSALKDIRLPPGAWSGLAFKAIGWNAVRVGELYSGLRTPSPFTPDAEDNRNRLEFEGRLGDIKSRSEPQPPPIPHCHYHPWCRERRR